MGLAAREGCAGLIEEIVCSAGFWPHPRLLRVKVDGTSPARRLPYIGDGAFHPTVASQGHRLAYESFHRDHNIWRLELVSGEADEPTAETGSPGKRIVPGVRKLWLSISRSARTGSRVGFPLSQVSQLQCSSRNVFRVPVINSLKGGTNQHGFSVESQQIIGFVLVNRCKC